MKELESEEYNLALLSLRQGGYTVAELCTCMGVEVPEYMTGIAEERVTSLSASLRNIQPGSAYFAVGSRFTYIANVKSAFERGAICAVSRMRILGDEGKELPCIVVDSPRYECAELSSLILAGKPATTIAITGSIGKTTTKEMIRLVSESEFVTQYSRSNENGFGQIVKYAQTLSPTTQVYIQETGLSEPSSIDRAGLVLCPDGFVITNIGWNHVGHFGGKQENILYEKMALDRRANHGAVGFINGDDPLLAKAEFKHHIITFGVQNEDVDYRAENVVSSNGRVMFDVHERKNDRRTPVTLNIVGEHNALDAVCAFAIGVWLGVDRSTIVEALAKFKSQGVRQNLIYLGGQHVYLDCYNASEGAINSVGETLKTIDVPEGGKRVFVVGDIDDKLGDRTEEIHRRVGRTLAAKPWIDLLICFGDHASWIAEEASKAGAWALKTSNRSELESLIREHVSHDDLIAFKGGQQMQLSKTVDSLFGTSFYMLDHDVIDPISVTEETEVGSFRVIDDYGAVLMKGTATGSVNIPAQISGTPVRALGVASFSRGKLTEVAIPEGVRSIGNSAFFSCYSLRQVQLPSTLEHIGQSAFNSCVKLESIVLPDGVKTLGARCFAYDRGLKTVVIPDSVKTIEQDVFFKTTGVCVVCSPDSYAASFMAENYPDLAVSFSPLSDEA